MDKIETEGQFLRAVKAIIDTDQKWTQGAAARKAGGAPCSSFGDDAVSFCLMGAICRVEDHMNNYHIIASAVSILDKLAGNYVQWQDKAGRTHAEVMELLDQCITVAERGKGFPQPETSADVS